MAATDYEQGRCADGQLHASRKALQGLKAVCDGRKITVVISGRFDPTARDACPDCVAATSE